jgi:hypothetical protein
LILVFLRCINAFRLIKSFVWLRKLFTFINREFDNIISFNCNIKIVGRRQNRSSIETAITGIYNSSFVYGMSNLFSVLSENGKRRIYYVLFYLYSEIVYVRNNS